MDEIHFTPNREFYSKELSSGYCVGLIYTARINDNVLQSLLPEWVACGDVSLVVSRQNNAGESSVCGQGHVK